MHSQHVQFSLDLYSTQSTKQGKVSSSQAVRLAAVKRASLEHQLLKHALVKHVLLKHAR